MRQGPRSFLNGMLGEAGDAEAKHIGAHAVKAAPYEAGVDEGALCRFGIRLPLWAVFPA